MEAHFRYWGAYSSQSGADVRSKVRNRAREYRVLVGPAELEFVDCNPSGAMVTVGSDGRPKLARVSVGVVEGRVMSSGTVDRVRTKRLRDDPRCTLFVFDGSGHWLGMETVVALVEGVGSAELNLRLARAIQKRPAGPLVWLGGQELDDPAFLAEMERDRRLVYRFDIERSYGELPGAQH